MQDLKKLTGAKQVGAGLITTGHEVIKPSAVKPVAARQRV